MRIQTGRPGYGRSWPGAAFAPDRVAVEFPRAGHDQLVRAYGDYLARPTEAIDDPKEVCQIGFRLARRLGHDLVFGVDVPMVLWHDSIQVFDDTYPGERDRLRARWPSPVPLSAEIDYSGTLLQILRQMNQDAPPRNAEMYGRFLPLARDDVYAGALKLRPWYDRNLRIVQNLFRIAEPADRRIVLVIGAGHLRILKQMLELTPQFCPVNALDYLTDA